jgi:hypothetical protein
MFPAASCIRNFVMERVIEQNNGFGGFTSILAGRTFRNGRSLSSFTPSFACS